MEIVLLILTLIAFVLYCAVVIIVINFLFRLIGYAVKKMYNNIKRKLSLKG